MQKEERVIETRKSHKIEGSAKKKKRAERRARVEAKNINDKRIVVRKLASRVGLVS